ncbi:hypothetical protein COU57_01005 [Candidatus Pacearchaeota archaeon CG10_big_fil_rev_8_21_14_0_10_32_14]|nr:MAG: hypothetical protein COU57_01005 [Candidatus Pacearchaeota archaeon CG10_big_fil_rev_8_21_14_0_10_32_14]
MEETLNIKKSALNDLIRLKDEFDAIIESIELSEDKEFMISYKKSKEQVNKRDFSDWNDL